MKTKDKILLTLFAIVALAAVFGLAWKVSPEPEIVIVEVEVPMSVQGTQLKLIELGYEWVYVPEQGDYNCVTPDHKWGNITEASYCQYMHDKITARMAGAGKEQ